MKRAVLGLFSVLSLASAGCAVDGTVGQDQAALVDGTPEGVGLLRFVNDPGTTFEVLDDQVPLDRRAAENLIAARPFASVDEVDAVKYVGEAAMARLVDYARSHGFVPEGDDVLGSYDGVTFTVAQADAVLRIVNEESHGVLDVEVGLDSRAATNIINARPIASMPRLADVYWVGGSALQRLRDHVTATSPDPDPLVRADCRGDSDCAADERCRGQFDAGTGIAIGKCAPLANPVGYWNECSNANPCGDDLFCSGLTWGGGGWCSPMWMQDTFVNTTQRSIPTDGSDVVTGVVVYGQASVPMDIVVDLTLSHSNPYALRITLLDPNGADAVLWNGPGKIGQPFPSSFVALGNISRDDTVNGRWLLKVTNVTGTGTGNLYGWQMWISSRWD